MKGATESMTEETEEMLRRIAALDKIARIVNASTRELEKLPKVLRQLPSDLSATQQLQRAVILGDHTAMRVLAPVVSALATSRIADLVTAAAKPEEQEREALPMRTGRAPSQGGSRLLRKAAIQPGGRA